MRINFRQGIISAQDEFGGFLNVNPTTVDLITSSRQLTLTAAQGTHNYSYHETASVAGAWTGTTTSGNYWLYWDFHKSTFIRTFGVTTLQPVAQGTAPASPTVDQHWFDTLNNRQMVWTGGVWSEVIRVFAGRLTDGVMFSMSGNAPSFYGTQIGNVSSIRTGRVVFDDSSKAIRRDDGSFITTEDQIFATSSRVASFRLESSVDYTTFLGPGNSVAAYTVVAYDSNGTGVNVAQYVDTGNTVLGVLTENLNSGTFDAGEVGSIVIQGVVTNPAWSWDTIGVDLWVLNGVLVETDPNISPGGVANTPAQVPVARVLSSDTVVFEQGLGGVGAAGTDGTDGATGATGAQGPAGDAPAYSGSPLLPDWGTPTNDLVLTSTEYNDVINELIEDKAQKAPTYANIAAFPTAANVRGMIVHAAAEDRLYYSDGTVWVPLMERVDTFAMPYDLSFFIGGNVDTANGIVGAYVATRTVNIQANLPGSKAVANTAATAQTIYIVNKVVAGTPTAVGTITFAAAGTTGTFASGAAINLAIDDVLTIVNPASPDIAIADVAITIVGCALTTTSVACP